jgi:hypothetical protein
MVSPSVLRFLAIFTGVREPNISPFRRSTFGDLTAALRLRETPAGPPGYFATRPTFSHLSDTGRQLAKASSPRGLPRHEAADATAYMRPRRYLAISLR